jgi:hypothetical protein
VPETPPVDSISRHEPCHAHARHREEALRLIPLGGCAARSRMTAGSP